MTYHYYQNCVGWPRRDVEDLQEMINDALRVSRRTFLKHVSRGDLRGLEQHLGYDSHWRRGLTMAGDGYVTYWRSTYKGKRVYYFAYSAIEYVFIKTADDHKR